MAKNEPATRRILRALPSLRPKLGIDPLTREPSLSFTVGNEREALDSLDLLFRYVREQKNHFALAIDEFQQVSSYPEKNLEALLRTHLQETTNATLIFSGSRKHTLTRIFSTPDRPFYNSTQMMEIGKISTGEYRSFIRERFDRHNVRIAPDAVDHILHLTASHTFYVQYMCNRLFSTGGQINKEKVDQMLLKIITENEAVYASYINLLTSLQFRILRAVALNDLFFDSWLKYRGDFNK